MGPVVNDDTEREVTDNSFFDFWLKPTDETGTGVFKTFQNWYLRLSVVVVRRSVGSKDII